MIRNILFALFSLIIALGFAGCGSDDNPVVDTSTHDNWVYLDAEPGSNMQLAFTESDHSITSGQPWGEVSASFQDGQLGIDVKAGRHGSSSVADWFKSHASAAWCANWPSGCPDWPSELNFAMTGTLTINGTSYPVTIGQGSTGIHNNWWIGGPGWSMDTTITGTDVVTPDGKYLINPMDDSFNEFQIATK